MASKKQQGDSFFSQAVNDVVNPDIKPEQPKTARKRRVNPGEMWRANLLLDADLEEPIFLYAHRQKTSVSALVSDIIREYIEKNVK